MILLRKHEFTYTDLALEMYSHCVNYFKIQRKIRRTFFPLSSIDCKAIEDRATPEYRKFINRVGSHHLKSAQNIQRKNFDSTTCNYYSRNLHFAAIYKHNIVGIVSLHCREKKSTYHPWELSGLNILKSYQGYGIAGKLVKASISGITTEKNLVYLSVLRNNYRAINLYRKLGFLPANMLKNRPQFQSLIPLDTATSLYMYKVV